jgi:hypothetical protein
LYKSDSVFIENEKSSDWKEEKCRQNERREHIDIAEEKMDAHTHTNTHTQRQYEKKQIENRPYD